MAGDLSASGASRGGVLWETLREAVGARVSQAGRAALDIVDVGGGTGGLAVPLAGLGHAVTVIDPSPDSLAAAQRRAADAGVSLRAVQGDVSDLAAAYGGEADVVLCHSVLEYVDAPEAAMAAIAGMLRPGGVVSVLAASAVAAVIQRVLAGRFAEAAWMIAAVPYDEAALPGSTVPGSAVPGIAGSAAREPLPRRFTLPALVTLIEKAGLRADPGHGVRVFADLVPAAVTDADPGVAGAVVALEQAAASHPAFRGLASQFHVLGFR